MCQDNSKNHRRLCIWIARRLQAVVLILLSILTGRAVADQDDAINVITGGSIVYDSNLFRLPGTLSPQATLGRSTKSDTLTTAYVGLRIDKPYAQQRFQLDITDTIYRYHTFSHLNFNAFDYRGAWLWHLTPRLSGTLSAERTQTLVPFEDYRLLSQQRDVRDNKNQTLNVDWWAFGGWHLLLGLANIEQKSEAALLAEADFSLIDRQGGVKYESASGNALTVVQHSRRGDYANRIPDPITDRKSVV